MSSAMELYQRQERDAQMRLDMDQRQADEMCQVQEEPCRELAILVARVESLRRENEIRDESLRRENEIRDGRLGRLEQAMQALSAKVNELTLGMEKRFNQSESAQWTRFWLLAGVVVAAAVGIALGR